ncbi:protein FLC EXPRESSOR-like isoform X3 [Hibiscus syriacus]|uniref:protein FLC EXPRESSOR-like isoform X3 n=1 Tax=Hibiscus syriacus TaxID=106335 RepID=UPI001922586C|nr:protein FLC EXPRESSOR-like isoform X3 [Hibiscus syriacus]
MAGRNNLTPPSSLTRSIIERHTIHQHHHLEDRIAIQHREIQSLLLDNQRLAAAHVALKQDLALAQQETRHLLAASANVKSERDAEVREIYERSLKMDAQTRSVDAMTSELARVRADVKKLMAGNQELKADLEAVNDELAKARMEAKQVPVLMADIEAVRKEIHKGGSAIELEKKTRASNLEQRQILEKLHSELANADKRARDTAAPSTATANPNLTYNGNYGNIDANYGGNYSMPQADVVCTQFVAEAGTMLPVTIEGQGSHTPNMNGLPSVSGAVSTVPFENQVVRL